MECLISYFLILKEKQRNVDEAESFATLLTFALELKALFLYISFSFIHNFRKKVYIAFQHSIAALRQQLQPMKISTNGNVVYSQTTLPLHHQWTILPVSHNLPFHSLLHR